MKKDNEIAGLIRCLDNLENIIKKVEPNIYYEDRMVAIDFLARDISHKILNSLNVINISAQFCLTYYAEHKELRNSLREIINNVGFANKFIEDILNLTSTKLHPRLTQTNDVVKQAIDLLKKDLNHKDIRVIFRNSKRVPKSFMDNVKLEQVFVNLLINSMNSLKKGGSISISSLFDRKTDDIIIHFRDSGKGIPQKYIEKVFTPSFSLSKKWEGPGLLICQSIIDSHGGNIFAENIKKEGTRITIQLPLQKSPS